MARSDTLELREPEGAFRAIEDWLRGHGFFASGGEGLAADLYLGYGLSETIRRSSSPAPTEPCPLPLAACTIRRQADIVARSHERLEIGVWERTWSGSSGASAPASA